MRCRSCPPRVQERCDAYYCAKCRGGLIGASKPHKLTEAEKYLVGILPERPPDARLQRILEAERIEREEYESLTGWLVQLGDMQEVMSL
jgi:hypothetical protein